MQSADSSTGPKAWLVTVGVATGGRGGGPKPKQGRLGIGWLQNKTLLVPSASVLGSQRLSGTSAGYRIRSTPLVHSLWWPRRFRAMASSKSRRAIYPGTNSTSLDINRVFRSGFIYGGGDDYVQPWVLWGGGGGKRLHLGGQASFFSLLFQYGVPAASSKHPGVAGAEGAESNLPGFGVRS